MESWLTLFFSNRILNHLQLTVFCSLGIRTHICFREKKVRIMYCTHDGITHAWRKSWSPDAKYVRCKKKTCLRHPQSGPEWVQLIKLSLSLTQRREKIWEAENASDLRIFYPPDLLPCLEKVGSGHWGRKSVRKRKARTYLMQRGSGDKNAQIMF